jgi:hypothetical protein
LERGSDADASNDEEAFLQPEGDGVSVECVEEAVAESAKCVAYPNDWADDPEARINLPG